MITNRSDMHCCTKESYLHWEDMTCLPEEMKVIRHANSIIPSLKAFCCVAGTVLFLYWLKLFSLPRVINIMVVSRDINSINLKLMKTLHLTLKVTNPSGDQNYISQQQVFLTTTLTQTIKLDEQLILLGTHILMKFFPIISSSQTQGG